MKKKIDLKTGFDMPKEKGLEPSHMRFCYGRHSNPKSTAIQNAKDFLTAVFDHRAKIKNPVTQSADTFSYDRLTDKNIGAIMHGIPKKAKELWDANGDSRITENIYGPNIMSRLKARDIYYMLRCSPIVGGDYEKPADLSSITSLVSLMLK